MVEPMSINLKSCLQFGLTLLLFAAAVFMVLGAVQCSHGQTPPTNSGQISNPVVNQPAVYMLPARGPCNFVRRTLGWPLVYRPYVAVCAPVLVQPVSPINIVGSRQRGDKVTQ